MHIFIKEWSLLSQTVILTSKHLIIMKQKEMSNAKKEQKDKVNSSLFNCKLEKHVPHQILTPETRLKPLRTTSPLLAKAN